MDAERAMTHGTATRLSSLPLRHHRRTTSTSSPASAASSRMKNIRRDVAAVRSAAETVARPAAPRSP